MKLIFNILSLSILTAILITPKAQAQITAEPNSTNTVVNRNGDTFTIQGGIQIDKNVFHSLQKFGLDNNQIADFVTNPGTKNVLGRITGGDASVINGLIKVTGSNANLYLMNPAGIIFGSGARLDVPGSFTATTANGIGFGDNWFNATGANNYADLIGEPSSFAFTMKEPGTIFNSVNLAVKSGQNLTLLGGTVVSTGELSAPTGEVKVVTVSGERVLRITPSKNILGFETKPIAALSNLPNNWSLSISSLPELLTGGESITNATDLEIRDNKVVLNGSGLKIENGDLFVKSLFARNATLSSKRNLISAGRTENGLTTTENLNLLAENTVNLLEDKDVSYSFFVLQVGGNLKVQGNQKIDINLNNDKSLFQTGGNLDLVSDGEISIGDGKFITGGNFSVKNLSGGAGNLNSNSLNSNGTNFKGIISSNGDVSFGNYEGSSLKVEAKGSISAGDIKINQPNTSLVGTDPDIAVLKNSPSLILRAGLNELRNAASTSPTSFNGTNFANTETSSSLGNITVGNITIEPSGDFQVLGPIILFAKNNINVNGKITSLGGFTFDDNSNFSDNNAKFQVAVHSPLILSSSEGSISVTDDIKTGNAMLLSKKDISAEDILVEKNSGMDDDDDGIALLNSETGKITVNTIQASFGSIDINAADIFQAKGTFSPSPPRPTLPGSGNRVIFPVSIQANRSINIQHGGKKFNYGIGLKKDVNGNIIYEIADSEKRVFPRTIDGNTSNFVDENGQPIGPGRVIVESVTFDINEIPVDESFTAGLIVRQDGRNQILNDVFIDRLFGGNSDINVVSIPRATDNTNPNQQFVQNQLNNNNKSFVCFLKSSTVALNSGENTRGGSATNNSLSSTSNPCGTNGKNNDNDILTIIKDNRFDSSSVLPTSLSELGRK